MTSLSPLSRPSSTGSPVRRFLLGATTALGLRAAAATPASAPSAPTAIGRLDAGADGELTAELAHLHDEHVERANAAVAEGREDLLQGISDSYVEQAMALMTGAGTPPVRSAHQLTA
ncbi:MAG: hypothetical protein JWR62_923 [Modestobacter sp.]|nr:hypothetical protein [Modestobacter sp.]